MEFIHCVPVWVWIMMAIAMWGVWSIIMFRLGKFCKIHKMKNIIDKQYKLIHNLRGRCTWLELENEHKPCHESNSTE